MKGWLCAFMNVLTFTMNMGRIKGCPHWIDFCFPGRCEDEGEGRMAVPFFPHITPHTHSIQWSYDQGCNGQAWKQGLHLIKKLF